MNFQVLVIKLLTKILSTLIVMTAHDKITGQQSAIAEKAMAEDSYFMDGMRFLKNEGEVEEERKVEWGSSGVKEPLNGKEINSLLRFIKERASQGNAFECHLPKKKIQWLKDNISSLVIEEIDLDDNWWCIGKDQDSVDALISDI